MSSAQTFPALNDTNTRSVSVHDVFRETKDTFSTLMNVKLESRGRGRGAGGLLGVMNAHLKKELTASETRVSVSII